jgi:hypothetical protein
VGSKFRYQGNGKPCPPVLVSLPLADHDLAQPEIDVLYAKPQTLQQSQTAPVEQLADQAVRTVELGEHGTDLVAGQDDRQSVRALGAHDLLQPGEFNLKYLLVEEQQGDEHPVLRRRRDLAAHDKVREERGHLLPRH